MHSLNGMYWGMGWWWIIGLVIIVTIVWITVKILKKSSNSYNSLRNNPIDTLKERYARGEIDKLEFDEKKSILEP